MSEDPIVLQLRSVARRYGEERQWSAVRDATFSIASGEHVAIVGRSGSGKSTLLNIIALLDSEWEGIYFINDLDVSTLDSKQEDKLRADYFGFVFQSSHANSYQSVARNVALGLSIQGYSIEQIKGRVTWALDVVGLTDKANALARSLSGGERQRLAIARAIVTRPRFIVADEPTGNLDSATAEMIMDVFEQLHRSGTTLIIVTHDKKVAARADRTLNMKDGILHMPKGSHEINSALDSDQGQVKQQDHRIWGRLSARVFRSLDSVTSRPARTLLLVVVFALALGGMVAASNVGLTASSQIVDKINLSARDEVRVNLSRETSEAQFQQIRQRVIGLNHVIENGRIAILETDYASTSRYSPLHGLEGSRHSGRTAAVDNGYLSINDSCIPLRELLKTWGTPGYENVALVGRKVAEELDLPVSGYGAQLWISGQPHQVIGIIRDSCDEQLLNFSVLVPISEHNDLPSQLVIKTEMGAAGPVARAVPYAISPQNPGEVSVESAGDLEVLRTGISTDLDRLLASLSIVLLVIAILSGAAVMFLSVQSRYQELALSRALGESKHGIAAGFLLEGAIIGLAGALAGMAGGMLLSVAIAIYNNWGPTFAWMPTLWSPLVGIFCGAVTAVLPAIRAARIDPAEAIR